MELHPQTETVVLQPTPFCNIDCRYCYLPSRNDRSVLALDTIETLMRQLFASGWAAPCLTLIWHAGEPLVLPVDYYEEAFAAIERLRLPQVQVRHAIQTNGMLITPQWCELFRKWQVGLGVSIDGPRDIHDANRVTRQGRGTFDRTLAGIRTLQREEVPFHVISVLSAAGLDAPDRMFEFYAGEGIVDVCFNVEESEGAHVSGLLAGAGVEQRFRAFLSRFWTLARADGRIRFIREIDAMIERVFRPDGVHMGNAQVQPFGMLNMDCHGNVSSFSPELLGLKDARYADYIVGNIHTGTLDAMLHGAAMASMAADIAEGTAACERECGYFSVCGGGSPINKLSENGRFASTHTAFCALVHKVPADLVLGALEQFERRLDAGDSPEVPSLPAAPSGPPRERSKSIPIVARNP